MSSIDQTTIDSFISGTLAVAERQNVLRAFVAGELNEQQNTAILEHAVESENVLGEMDSLWNEWPVGEPRLFVPEMQIEADLAEKIIGRINRSNLSGDAIRLGTQGFFGVLWAMFRPLVEGSQSQGAKTDD